MSYKRSGVDEDFYYNLPWNSSFQDLRFVFAGRDHCRSLHSWGPAVRPNYIIHYIMAGKGIYRVGEQTWELHEKQGFLIEPEVETFYQADMNDPWTYCWIGFDGKIVPEMLSQMGLGGGRLTFSCDAKEELEEILEDILSGSWFGSISLGWTEEIISCFTTWMVFLGYAYLCERDQHVCVTILHDAVPVTCCQGLFNTLIRMRI